jgi:hypothetical protein
MGRGLCTGAHHRVKTSRPNYEIFRESSSGINNTGHRDPNVLLQILKEASRRQVGHSLHSRGTEVRLLLRTRYFFLFFTFSQAIVGQTQPSIR